jgi:hypothetical protein
MLQGEVHQTALTVLLPYNHLGPFESREEVIIPNANLGGRASTTVTLDLRGLVTGTVAFYNMRGDLRSVSWATVFMNGPAACTIYSWDGFYEAYLPRGAYTITVAEAGLTTQNVTAAVPDGEVARLNFYLRPNGIPIPEYAEYRMLNVFTAVASISILFAVMIRRARRPP